MQDRQKGFQQIISKDLENQLKGSMICKSTTTSLEKNIQTFPKKNCPEFLKGREHIYYESKSDLEYKDVMEAAIMLYSLKGIEVSENTKKAWYIEFLKRNWSRAYFLGRFEQVKKQKLYGRLDLADWFDLENIYTQDEFDKALREAITRKIELGKRLANNPPKEVTPEMQESIELHASQVIEQENYRLRRELEEKEIEKRTKFLREENKEKKNLIKTFNEKQIEKLVEIVNGKRLFSQLTNLETYLIKKYPEGHAEQFTLEELNKIASGCN